MVNGISGESRSKKLNYSQFPVSGVILCHIRYQSQFSDSVQAGQGGERRGNAPPELCCNIYLTEHYQRRLWDPLFFESPHIASPPSTESCLINCSLKKRPPTAARLCASGDERPKRAVKSALTVARLAFHSAYCLRPHHHSR
jgi:hypothetical protein